MSVPVATERKSFLPLRLRPTGIVGPHSTLPMPSVSENNDKSSLTVGNQVLVNGLKSGTLRYIGTVQFAQGLFCGVELDQPDGKHDGQVKDIRYFQCAPNHGIFVPRDKVVLAPRTRALSSQRPISRLKPPTLTRSITLSSSINNIEQSKSIQLPDIVPNSISQPVILDESILNDNHEIIISTEQPKEETINIVEPNMEFQPLPIDEPPETIEVDFTASVSLILHQLQQEQKIERHSSSITISEEDIDDDDDDELDNESVIESIIDEQIDKTHHSLSSSAFLSIDLTKSIQTDLSFHSNDNISFTKIELSTPINKKKATIQPVKKNIERRPVVPVTNTTKRPITRKPAIISVKKGPATKPQRNSTQPVASSQSKLNVSLSSSNSLNSSQSDVASINKTPKQISDTIIPNKSQLTNIPSASSEKKHDESHDILITLNQSLEANNQRLKKYSQHLLNQFDLMFILSQYFLNENEQNELQLSKARTRNDRLKNSIEQLRLSHKNELFSLDKQYQIQIETLNQTHDQQLNEYQQKTDHLLHEKTELESHCLSLQEKVDGFLSEMANSEHADLLLCHVEVLEKDRTSLQAVLELKYKEIAQLRTKLNEQEIKLSDENALKKRINMAENRIQDLEWLLRGKQLSKKAVVMERDELKERTAQLERDNCQLKFENETLHYRLRERSLSVSTPSDHPTKLISIPPREKQIRNRVRSLSSTMISPHENERMTRSLSSLNCIHNR